MRDNHKKGAIVYFSRNAAGISVVEKELLSPAEGWQTFSYPDYGLGCVLVSDL